MAIVWRRAPLRQEHFFFFACARTTKRSAARVKIEQWEKRADMTVGETGKV